MKPKLTHSEPLMKASNILQLDDLYKSKCLSMLQNCKNDACPAAIKPMFAWQPPTSRRHGLMIENSATSSLINSLPPATFPRIWNNYFERNKYDLNHIGSTNKFFNYTIKSNFLLNYYSKCDLKKCYVCTQEPDKPGNK